MRGLTRFALALVVSAVACSNDGGPSNGSSPGDTRPAADLNVVRTAAGTTIDAGVSFYAVAGKARDAVLYFRSAAGAAQGEFAHISFGSTAALSLPGGVSLLQGDSVLITMRIVDPARLNVEFLPAGLLFTGAQLDMRYAGADTDFNGDGKRNADDDRIEGNLGIWKQELPLAPFVRLNSSLSRSSKSATAEITGFTRYALAY